MGEMAESMFPGEVREAIQAFSKSFTETQQFRTWKKRLQNVAKDKKALTLSQQIRQEQTAVGGEPVREQMNSERQRKVEKLFESYEVLPAVIAYREAEAQFRTVCVQANAAVSDGLGIDFASHCARGCCG